nr:hypothetical protein [uncultured Rhodoferax sp.]
MHTHSFLRRRGINPKGVWLAALVALLACLVALALWQQRMPELPPPVAPVATPSPDLDSEVIGVDGGSVRSYESFPMMPVPSDHAFAIRELASLADLASEMPAVLRANLAEKVAALPCGSQRMKLFERPGSATLLNLTECRRPWIEPGTESRVVDNYNFGALWIWDANGLHDVPALARYFGFMYESGAVIGVTDRNGNGRLELWLSGTTCEPGEDDEPGDYCQGLWIVEVSGRRLQVLDPQKLVALPTNPMKKSTGD